MMCAWNALLGILPQKLRRDVDSQGRDSLQELRLRLHAPPELVLGTGSRWLNGDVSQEDLSFIVNTASRYSPWTAQTMSQGFLTAEGGHRIGVCGQVVCQQGEVTGIREIQSLCIRVARDYPEMGKQLDGLDTSALIIGAPGWGKTTLLRCLIRSYSQRMAVGVVDERSELFPPAFSRGKRTDILTGCPKAAGIERLLRTMGPGCIAVDEITADVDCHALAAAANCGVKLLATAHAGSKEDFCARPVYRELIAQGVFQRLIVLRPDRSYHVERMA